MKLKNLILGAWTCAAFAACSNDATEVPGKPAVFGQDEAYVAFNIVSANGQSTRGEANNPPFYYGTEAEESNVSSAEFYFYDANGIFVTSASGWNEGATNGSDSETDNTIEHVGSPVVLLQGLKDKSYPSYVVVLLNVPAGFELGATLEEAQKTLAGGIKNGTDFYMSSSTFSGNDAAGYWFATAVSESNFTQEPPTDQDLTDNAVNVYVERLAAKVGLQFAASAEVSDNKVTLAKYTVDGVKKDLVLEIVGWGLNATAKDSYMMKNVPAWTTDLGFTWNDAANYRSYWALSYNYGTGEYPSNYGETVEGGVSDIKEKTLNYISWNDASAGISDVLYCPENTNSVEILTQEAFNPVVTSALIAARISGGEDLIRYDNSLYSKEGYAARVLNKARLNKIWTLAAEDEITGDKTYRTADESDLEVVYLYDGRISMQFTATAKELEWYLDENGDGDPIENIDALLSNIGSAECYKGGMMYYSIPIEHLRNGKWSIGDNGIEVNEGDYGVVRNHYYRITVSKIENLGAAVYDPSENIVPNDEDNTTYCLSSVINILSWKIVNQSVTL